MTSVDRTCRLDMKHGFVKQIIKNQVCRDEYDKEIKVSNSQTKVKTKHGTTKESQNYYLPPKMRKQSDAKVVEEKPEDNKAVLMTVDRRDEDRALFKLEYVDQHGNIHVRVVHMGDNSEEIAQELAIKTNLSEDLCACLQVRILKNITTYTRN
ncbi:UPF0561 protein C2orf68 homolog [Antedon mediterranea]|uniref:UPF0561 protein C2orf68 homolog n=1 Tax=Antedon mediterranea TaxID=105859 RepID=UPI003AF8D005